MRRLLAVVGLLILAAVLFHVQLLTALGQFLVDAEAPRKADLIVVLGGDYHGQRVLKACDLVRQGYAPKAVVSGPRAFFGLHEDRFAIDFAVERGCDRSYFEGAPSDVNSTESEAAFFHEFLQRRGVRHYLLVTSNFHTRRSGKIFRQMAPGLELTVIAAPHPEFEPHSWWKTREGQKVFAYEWIKTITGAMGI